jgi:hypothetical protein
MLTRFRFWRSSGFPPTSGFLVALCLPVLLSPGLSGVPLASLVALAVWRVSQFVPLSINVYFARLSLVPGSRL